MAREVPEVWAGVECSFLAIGTGRRDQLSETGHASRDADLRRLAGLGVRAVRYPVLWGWPDGRPETDWEWAAARLDGLRRLGLRPVVGLLHHGFGPDGADPLDPGWPRRFERYVGAALRHVPDIDAFLPINEPLTTARFAGSYGWWPPYGSNANVFARLLLAQCAAIQRASALIRDRRAGATIVVNEDVGRAVGPEILAGAVRSHDVRRWATFDLLEGRVTPDHELWPVLAVDDRARRLLDHLASEPVRPDILGLDYYVTSDRYLDQRADHAAAPGGEGASPAATVHDIELVRVHGHELEGFAGRIKEAWERYRRPLALTEVQLAGRPADQVAWWLEAWQAATAAAREGVPVVSVTSWAAFGAWDWDSIMRRHGQTYEAGAYAVDGGHVRRTRLGSTVAATARGGQARQPGIGWWRRSDRFRYRPRALEESPG